MRYLSRRELLAGLALSLGQSPATTFAQPEDSAIVEAWMEKWIEEAKARPFDAPLHLSRFVEPIYYLLKPTIWLPVSSQEARFKSITVPIGFVTDFASIPRLFWWRLRPDGNYTHPAIAHDYLYWTQTTTRETADEMFRVMMEDFSIPTVDATAIYYAVRIAGGWAWDANKKAKENREKRILKRFPTDPKTKWADWKRDPSNFE